MLCLSCMDRRDTNWDFLKLLQPERLLWSPSMWNYHIYYLFSHVKIYKNTYISHDFKSSLFCCHIWKCVCRNNMWKCWRTCELHICTQFHMCINISMFSCVELYIHMWKFAKMCNSHVRTYVSHDFESSLSCFHIWKCVSSHVNCTFVHIFTCAFHMCVVI